jgi:hypothetical protein
VSNESLAKKIAELLDAERPTVDLSGIEAVIKQLGDRIEKLETKSSENTKPSIASAQSAHPSLDKLAVAEAIADQIFGGAGKEKACTFEPNGKPCDHCSMCNSRGF